MDHYRLYFRTPQTDRAQMRVELITAADDKAALEQARRFIGEHRLELWLRGRRICTIDADGQVKAPRAPASAPAPAAPSEPGAQA